MSFFLSVLGLILILEGLPYFAFPEKMKAWLEKIPQMPVHNLRIFGISAIILGLVLIYIAQRLL
jgi:uncharacterized protein YjeT (DUF2065 family)